MTRRTLAPLAALALALALAGCPDPVGDAPRATVAEPSAAVPTPTTGAPSPLPGPAAAPGATPKTVRYVFAGDDGASKIAFVGAKVTKQHDGGFTSFRGTVDAREGELASAMIDVEIDMDSVFTDSAKLTGHLKKPDFFDVATYPKARFISTSLQPNPDGTTAVSGNLTLHGVTKQITFPAKITTAGDTAKAEAAFGINRKDFGIMYPGAPDDLVADEVLLKLDITAKRGR